MVKLKRGINNMPTLPMELIISILLRLPVKPLCKFKSVSKQWFHSIAKDPYFVSMHRQLRLQNPNILLIEKIPSTQKSHPSRLNLYSFNVDGPSVKSVATFSLNVSGDFVILYSKRGIICFVCQNIFYACNPSKQMIWTLPSATSYGFRDVVTVGMGYVKERDEYVIVRLFNMRYDVQIGGYDPGWEVLRLSDGKDREWELLHVDCPFDIRNLGQSEVFVENVFYWYVWIEYRKPGDKAIYFFDLGKEKFGRCSPPESRGQGVFLDLSRFWKLVEMDGSLCVVDYLSGHTMDIWVMKDYADRTWVLDYSIDMTPYGPDKYFWTSVVPLDYRKGVIWLDVDKQRVDYYDVEKKCIKTMDFLIAGNSTMMDRLFTGTCKWLQLYTESWFSSGSR